MDLKRAALIISGCAVLTSMTLGPAGAAPRPRAQQQPTAQNPEGNPEPQPAGAGLGVNGGQANPNALKVVLGSVKTIDGNSVTLKPDSGADVKLNVLPNARVRRVAPGQTDLKTAATIQLSDVQVGDRIEIAGRPASDGKSWDVTTVIVMKASDVAAKQTSDMADWQRRGIGGIVSSVDPGSKTVAISITGPGGVKQQLTIHTAANTVIRRYAQGSVEFSNAKVGTIDSIKPGDQLRVLGNRTGTDITAEQMVSGSFQDVSGIVNAVDADAKTLTVQDVATKKAVVVRITPQAKIVNLPPQIAQGFAARVNPNAAAARGNGGNAGGANAEGGNAGAGNAGGENAAAAQGGGFRGGRGGGPGGRGGRGGATAADLQQIVNAQPAAMLSDLKKGDTVMVVGSTDLANTTDVTAITVVGGVDAILRAAPEQSMNLSQWNLGGGGGDAQ